MYVFINIGSNKGNRRLNLSKAMRAVSMEFGPFELSHTVETEPWGYESQNKFLNVGMMFQTDKSPSCVLHILQDIEKSISVDSHRDGAGNYIDRIIDIDIVAIDDKVIDTVELTVPHPHLAERIFFLQPMQEIAPQWHHPITGLTAEDMIAALPADKRK